MTPSLAPRPDLAPPRPRANLRDLAPSPLPIGRGRGREPTGDHPGGRPRPTGCEPYTLAMALHEAGITKARILASDMNPERVKLAADARYLACEVDIDVAMGRLPESRRARCFEDAAKMIANLRRVRPRR